jgi:uncharacterized protein with PIN domain
MEHSRNEYKERKVVGTRLSYKDKYPSSEKKKESQSIEFLKDFNFREIKRCPECKRKFLKGV